MRPAMFVEMLPPQVHYSRYCRHYPAELHTLTSLLSFRTVRKPVAVQPKLHLQMQSQYWAAPLALYAPGSAGTCRWLVDQRCAQCLPRAVASASSGRPFWRIAGRGTEAMLHKILSYCLATAQQIGLSRMSSPFAV